MNQFGFFNIIDHSSTEPKTMECHKHWKLNDDTLLNRNFKWLALEWAQRGDKGRMMTMVIAYVTVFGENRKPLEGHAILGSWEVGSNSVYIMDLSRHARSQTNPNLTPEIRTKIEKAFRLTGINQIIYGRDGLGIRSSSMATPALLLAGWPRYFWAAAWELCQNLALRMNTLLSEWWPANCYNFRNMKKFRCRQK